MFTTVIGAGGVAGITLAVIAAINAVIAFYYYARVARTIWFEAPSDDTVFTDAPVGSMVWVLGIAAVATVVIGVFPSISAFLGEATQVLVAAVGG
jgi:NADH-quinone oxidoreductase subunit N